MASTGHAGSLRTGLARTGGVCSLFLGGGFIILAILSMHRLVEDQSQESGNIGREIEITREQQRQKKLVKPQETRKPKPTKAPRAPLPQLDSLLAGLDLGIPEFAVEEFSNSAQSLFGNVSRGGIMSESSVDSKPRVVSRTPMNYPRSALKKRINGYVLINLLINESGDIEAAKVLDAEPKGVFEAEALRGIQTWRFAPARYQGKPVKVWAKQRVRFDSR